MGGRRVKANPKSNPGSHVKKIAFAAAGVLGAGLAIKDKGAAAPAMKVSPASPLENDPHFLTAPLTGVYPVGVRSQYAGPLLIDIHYPGVQSGEARYKVHPVTTAKHPMSIQGIEDPEKREQLSNLWTRSQPGLQAVEGKFPVVIFSPGMAGNHFDNQNIVEELASHGYCVITVSHPASNLSSDLAQITPPDDPPPGVKERMFAIREQAADVLFLVDQIKAGALGPNIDPDRIGVAGHSLGGDTALEACRQSGAIRAGVELDSGTLKHTTQVGVDQPFLTIVAGNGAFGQREKIDGEIWDYQKDWEDYSARSPQATLRIVDNADHDSFSLDHHHKAVKTGVANPHTVEINRTTNCHVVDFFDKHLKCEKNHVLLLLGQSSVGKSSILQEVERQIPDSLSVDQDGFKLSQDAAFAKQTFPDLYARAEKALEPVYIARYFRGSTYPEMLHWKPGTSDPLRTDAMKALTELYKHLKEMPAQYKTVKEALDPAGNERDAISRYLKGLTPSEKLPWKAGIPSEAREEAQQALKELGQYYHEMGEKTWTILDTLPDYHSHERNQMGLAIKKSQERSLVALDAWENPAQFFKCCQDQKFTGSIKVGLAYCPFSELLKRVTERNAKALGPGGSPNELRCPTDPITGFTDFYRPAKTGEPVLETLHRDEVEQIFESAFQQELSFFAARASEDPNSKREYTWLANAKNHDEMKNGLMTKLGFGDAGIKKVDITPRFQGYHYLFNTRDETPAECVSRIRSWSYQK